MSLKAACVGLRHGHASGLTGTFKLLEGVEVVAFCEDTDMEKLDALRENNPDVRLYTSVEELIEKEEFEVACVALPANEVPGVGIKLANAGKHFLMEKQFARNTEEMRPLVDAVQANSVKVLAHYPWRAHPAVKSIKDHLEEGTLGRPLAIHAQLVTSQVRPGFRGPEGLAYRNDTEGGGILHMLGGHWLEAMRFLMGGEVTSVQAVCRSVNGFMEGENMDDVSVVAMEFENGAVGNLYMGYLQAASGGYESGLQLWGTEGSVAWPEMGASTLELRSRSWDDNPRTLTFDLAPKEDVYGNEQWLFDLAQDFIQAIQEDRQPQVTALDGFRCLQIIDAAYESSKTGQRVEI